MIRLIPKQFGRRNRRAGFDDQPAPKLPRRSVLAIIERHKWLLLILGAVLVVCLLGWLLYSMLFQPYSARRVLYVLCAWAVMNVMHYLWCGYVPDVSNPRRLMETIQMVVVTVIAAALGL
jgi:succinate dehydrogenase hydrophobic anchor subunit